MRRRNNFSKRVKLIIPEHNAKTLTKLRRRRDIFQVIEEQFRLSKLQESILKKQRKAYRATQTASINLPSKAALKLLTAGIAKIG